MNQRLRARSHRAWLFCQAIGRTSCNGTCISQAQFAIDPMNCGQCGQVCATDEVCVQGQCRTCGATKFPVCVDGNECP